jgi:hypothetical protein
VFFAPIDEVKNVYEIFVSFIDELSTTSSIGATVSLLWCDPFSSLFTFMVLFFVLDHVVLAVS